MIPVTRPYLPNRTTLDRYIDGIYQRQWLTNNGPLVRQLRDRLACHLGVDNLLLVGNGTLALQIAYRAVGMGRVETTDKGDVITTPFTYVATASSLTWEGYTPVYADIDPESWCVDPQCIAASVTERTVGLVPVHVFGNPCDVDAIAEIAERNGLKVVYDAAPAFGVTYRGESVLRWGDASTLSFHATKLFHAVEGGAIAFRHPDDMARAEKMLNFGLEAPASVSEVGINAKMNEFEAAMGLSLLDELDVNEAARRDVWERYEAGLSGALKKQCWASRASRNYAYLPIVLDSPETATQLLEALEAHGIMARRYFYPSLDTVGVLHGQGTCRVSQDIASRIVCLPLYPELPFEDVDRISAVVNTVLSGRC